MTEPGGRRYGLATTSALGVFLLFAGCSTRSAGPERLDLLGEAGSVMLTSQPKVFAAPVTFRAQDLPFLQVDLAATSSGKGSAVLKVAWNPLPEATVSDGVIQVIREHEPRSRHKLNRGVATLRFETLQDGPGRIVEDLSHIAAGKHFDAFRGEIKDLTIEVRGSGAELRSLELIAPTPRQRRRFFCQRWIWPAEVHQNVLFSLLLLPLFYVVIRVQGDGTGSFPKAVVLLWTFISLPVLLKAPLDIRQAVELLVDGRLAASGLSTEMDSLGSVLTGFRHELPPHSEIGLFTGREWSRMTYLAGYLLPLRNFYRSDPDRRFQLHLGPESLPRWCHEDGAVKRVRVARGRPLVQTLVAPVDLMAMELKVGATRIPEGAVLEGRFWRGNEKGKLVGKSYLGEDNRFVFRPPLELCGGETYLFELKLFNSQAPVGLTVGTNDPYPSGALRGSRFRDADLHFVLRLVPAGTELLSTAASGAMLFERTEAVGACD